jgi:hypothetical protein
MDITTEFECELCGGRGYTSVSNGVDDYQEVYCSCDKGRELEAAEIEQKVPEFDVATVAPFIMGMRRLDI